MSYVSVALSRDLFNTGRNVFSRLRYTDFFFFNGTLYILRIVTFPYALSARPPPSVWYLKPLWSQNVADSGDFWNRLLVLWTSTKISRD